MTQPTDAPNAAPNTTPDAAPNAVSEAAPNALPGAAPQAAPHADPKPARHADAPLLSCLLGLLTPLLMTAGLTDVALARRAAAEAIAAYRAAGADQLVSIAQIVGFALASLDNLRLSATPEQSVSMTLRLRGNANALNRAAQQATATLAVQRQDAPGMDLPAPDLPAPDLPAPDLPAMDAPAMDAPEPVPPDATHAVRPPPAANLMADHAEPAAPSLPTEQRRRLAWADAMAGVAAECSRSLASLAPAQRRAEMIRIGALNATAQRLRRPDSPTRERDNPRLNQPRP